MSLSGTQRAQPTGEMLQVLGVQKPLLKMKTFQLEQEGAEVGVLESGKRNHRGNQWIAGVSEREMASPKQ